ncbi:S8 family serine peptidase [Streptomyces sp. NBC_01264]|uniref:S8 family serine peptidase n=1 Tax=Streptomyces sp. NBC_01264 TaxID=2903804 RepID=UPI002253F940|nr:S8 family serine peptidase [Streptomyces sp. NBC_01264]MCX4778033.1 S8 family serine peptidase [Streptomyces sp. NBC_01264]
MTPPRRSTALPAVALALALTATLAPLTSAAATAGTAGAGEKGARYIVVLADAAPDPAALADRQTRRFRTTPTARFRHALKGYAAELTESQAAELRRDRAVRFVAAERSYGHPVSAEPRTVPPRTAAPGATAPGAAVRCGAVPDLTVRQCLPEWADRIDAEKSSARSGDGRGRATDVNVALIDSGIAGGHPDLNVRGGADCLTGTPVLPGAALQDPQEVGTALAAVVGAKDNDRGIVGVAPGAPLWSVKVFPDDGRAALDSSVLCALDWVASTRADADPGNDITVANMSFGTLRLYQQADDGHCGTVNNDALHLAVCNTTRAGVTLVASGAGANVGIAMEAPGSYDEVLTSTAMSDMDGRPGAKAAPECYGIELGSVGHADDQATLRFAEFARSAADRRHIVAAPGICIATTPRPQDPLPAIYFGTGLTAPVVTGIAALCVHSGRCEDGAPARTIRTLVDDAAAHSRRHEEYGFYGDPSRPIRGRHYGPLVSAARY